MRGVLRIASIALMAMAAMSVWPLLAADAERGRLLYESRCDICHDTGIHLRASRKARNFDEIREQVMRWNAELGGAWKSEEIDDVTRYLNGRFYLFPCPERICGTGQASARL